MKQYNYANRAGCVALRMSGQYGVQIGLYRADQAGLDTSGGPWVTVCEQHNTIANHASLSLARGHLAGMMWCEQCVKLHEGATTALRTVEIAARATPAFMRHADSLFLLAMLSNRAAKTDATFWPLKALLLSEACARADRECWWADTHVHGDYADTVIIATTRWGQMPFHVRSSDPLLAETLQSAPKAEGRRWSRVPIQEHAPALARAFARRYT